MPAIAKRNPLDADSAGTRARIVEVARALIREHGYDGVSTAMVLEVSEVSRGGLYHHFAGKRELLAAVLEAVERDFVLALAGEVAEAPDAHSAVLVGVQWYLDACLQSEELRQVGIVEGRKALGWELWRATIDPYGVAMFAATLEQVSEGRWDAARARSLAYLLLAALHEAAELVIESPEPARERERVGSAIDVLAKGVLDQLSA